MTKALRVVVDGVAIQVAAGATVAAAVAISGSSALRFSLSGEPRGPLCGMGICFECRVTVNDLPHQRGCQVLCSEGMEIRTR